MALNVIQKLDLIRFKKFMHSLANIIFIALYISSDSIRAQRCAICESL